MDVQFSCSVVSDSLWPNESQHARPPCPSPAPGVYSNPCPSSRWCHPATSSSVVPFSSCPQSLPASASFPTSQLFAWGGQSTGVSASTSVLPMNTKDWSPLGWTGWIFLQSKGLLRVLLQHHSSKASILRFSVFFTVQLSHLYMTTGKTITLTRRTFVGKWIFVMDEELLIVDEPRKWFHLKMKSTLGIHSWRHYEDRWNNKNYDINLAEEAASGFERTGSNFARISTVGKMQSSSTACYREIISERKKSANLHGKVYGCLTKEMAKVTPTFSNHLHGQSAATNTEVRLYTSKKIMTH